VSVQGGADALRFGPVAATALRIADSLKSCPAGLRNRLRSRTQWTAVPSLARTALSDGIRFFHLALTMAATHLGSPRFPIVEIFGPAGRGKAPETAITLCFKEYRSWGINHNKLWLVFLQNTRYCAFGTSGELLKKLPSS
jgi:hypothetical protein